MAKIIVTKGGIQIREMTLQEGKITIGRCPDNDLVLDNRAVSGYHATLTTIYKDSFLEDLDSTNGTQVNFHSIRNQKHYLQHADVIRIARYNLRYEVEPEEKKEERASASAGLCTLASLTVIDGTGTGKEIVLSNVLTPIGQAGKQLAMVMRRAQRYELTHIEGRESIRVNDMELTREAYPLKDGDMIVIAGTAMQFSWKPS